MTTYYEVFKKRIIAKLVDFKTHTYSDTLFKVQYPKRNAFGAWAWTVKTLERAEIKLKEFKRKKND
jgi:hypothetical protein